MSTVLPIKTPNPAGPSSTTISLLENDSLLDSIHQLSDFCKQQAELSSLSTQPRWLKIFQDGMKHRSMALEARVDGRLVGYLPLVLMKSILFGKRLVSLPYVNSSGVCATNPEVEELLVAEAIKLADQLQVKSLELRHEHQVNHSQLSAPATQKIHMRLQLPDSTDLLWKSFEPKVRNQIRKGEKNNLAVAWGTHELLPAFYSIFARNMRDLGTPVFGQILFRSILKAFPEQAELCVVQQGEKPLAAALLLHGKGITEVPSASSLREYNSTCANMLMYWHLLQRAVRRGQSVFDFGRSSPDSPTHQFKKQWGAKPFPAVWQYYLRHGSTADIRPDNPKFRLMIKTWKKLPLWLTRWIGPPIARVIP